MRILITGSGGLVGSEASVYFGRERHQIAGIDNDSRSRFFGKSASVMSQIAAVERMGLNYVHYWADIVDRIEVEDLIRKIRPEVIIHAAAQPSHDWAAKDPHLDFGINAVGTLNLLEATRQYCPESLFIFTSTNKVYGDTPNKLSFQELGTRWELTPYHKYRHGIDESMSIDDSTHSLFGVSKASADLLVQEYGKYFGMNTVCFRCGCITGPAHQGAELHGFLAYMMKCAVEDIKYSVYGYKSKQVRDNIHATDLIKAFDCFIQKPRQGEVYNIGGSRVSNCSLMEALDMSSQIAGCEIRTKYCEKPRIGDHQWWISDVRKFQSHYPEWHISCGTKDILEEIYDRLTAR